MQNSSQVTFFQESRHLNPLWVDTTEYPFTPHFVETDEGRLHYIDEGQGEPIVMVHGTPTWSFLYRRQIKTLSKRFRCIALDNLGFGLSDKPAKGSYMPEDHARRLANFLDSLDLRNITLVVHDFGGPIGLNYALRNPGRVKKIVLFNTWMWSLADEPRVRMADRLVRGALGSLLYRRMNASPRFLMPQAVYNRASMPPTLHQQYLHPFPDPDSRGGMLALARALMGSSPWYDSLWNDRANLRNTPALILWGMKDITFSSTDLERWKKVFSNCETVPFPQSGHFVQEEVNADVLNGIIARFIDAGA